MFIPLFCTEMIKHITLTVYQRKKNKDVAEFSSQHCNIDVDEKRKAKIVTNVSVLTL